MFQLISCTQCAECWPEALAECVDDFEYTVSLRCPHKKKSEGHKSGDRGGHNLFEMRLPGNTDYK
jgi:hypothetical protein